MKAFVVLALSLFTVSAFANIGDVNCTMENGRITIKTNPDSTYLVLATVRGDRITATDNSVDVSKVAREAAAKNPWTAGNFYGMKRIDGTQVIIEMTVARIENGTYKGELKATAELGRAEDPLNNGTSVGDLRCYRSLN